MRCAFYIFLMANAVLTLSHGARILVVFPADVHSHFTLGFRMAKELADRGHEVTFINAYPQEKSIKNLKEIPVVEIKTNFEEKKRGLYSMGTLSYLGQLEYVSGYGDSYTEKVFQVKVVQELLHSNETFDLVLLEHFLNEAMAVFSYKFKCPLIMLEGGPPTVFNNHIFANPSQPAYVPNILTDFGSDMTLWERIQNVYYDVVGELFAYFVRLPNQNAILQKVLPGAPDLRDILYNASFQFLISHISLRDPSPLQPNTKEIGGYHILPSKRLPHDLQEFLDSAKEGVVVFSMGASLKSVYFPEEKKEVAIKTFSRLKQKVLWKFETNLPYKPENVKIVSWLPQQDVLAHPNVILFITHAGLLGKIEAIYHGVPLLGLPVFWDQRKNSYDATRQGFALTIPFLELTEENFDWALNELITNPKYRENAKIRSKILRDQPMKPIDEAMFWIEYVIRHKGAPHYRSPALNLKWYQRLLLDVIFVVGITVALTFAIIFCIFKLIFNGIVGKILKKNGQKLD